MTAAAKGCGSDCAPKPANLRSFGGRPSGSPICSARADFVPPYELYAEILGAQGGRRMLLERLGLEAEDPIEEFLALALSYEREHVPSLQGFLRWLVAGDTEVKRDFGARQRDEVRIIDGARREGARSAGGLSARHDAAAEPAGHAAVDGA